jgi:hypothetical protein
MKLAERIENFPPNSVPSKQPLFIQVHGHPAARRLSRDLWLVTCDLWLVTCDFGVGEERRGACPAASSAPLPSWMGHPWWRCIHPAGIDVILDLMWVCIIGAAATLDRSSMEKMYPSDGNHCHPRLDVGPSSRPRPATGNHPRLLSLS